MRELLYRERGLIGVSMFFAVFMLVGLYRVELLAQENRRYTCRFVNDLAARHESGEKYLADVLHGRRQIIPGLTIADLQRTLDAQHTTLQAFEGLDC